LNSQVSIKFYINSSSKTSKSAARRNLSPSSKIKTYPKEEISNLKGTFKNQVDRNIHFDSHGLQQTSEQRIFFFVKFGFSLINFSAVAWPLNVNRFAYFVDKDEVLISQGAPMKFQNHWHPWTTLLLYAYMACMYFNIIFTSNYKRIFKCPQNWHSNIS
jgi:hypothetical protein